jgi:hypothetical protein
VGTALLSSLIPKPIRISNDEVSGELFVDGNFEYKKLMFRFRFDKPDEVAPLLIQIEDTTGKSYQYCCNRYDFSNPVIKSRILHVEFPLCGGIRVLKVMPVVSYIRAMKKI